MRLFVLCLCAVTACAPFPEVDRPAEARAGDFPALVPIETILAGVPPAATTRPAAGLPARVAALNARASRLRGPVIAPPLRARMQRGIVR